MGILMLRARHLKYRKSPDDDVFIQHYRYSHRRSVPDFMLRFLPGQIADLYMRIGQETSMSFTTCASNAGKVGTEGPRSLHLPWHHTVLDRLLRLKKRAEIQEAEDKRQRWFNSKKDSLRGRMSDSNDGRRLATLFKARWYSFQRGRESNSPDYRDIDQVPVWLPRDVHDGTIFCTRPWRGRQASSSSLSTSHAVEVPSTHPSVSAEHLDHHALTNLPQKKYLIDQGLRIGGSAPDILLGPGRRPGDETSTSTSVSERNSLFVADSWSTVSRSLSSPSRTPTHSSSPGADTSGRTKSEWEKLSPMMKLVAVTWITTVAIVNAIFLCGSCVMCWKGVRKLKAARRNARIEREMQARRPASVRFERSMLYQCPVCDRDFEQQRQTRQWQRVHEVSWHAHVNRHHSKLGRLLVRLHTPLGALYTKGVILSLGRAFGSLIRRWDFVEEMHQAAKARVAAYDMEYEEEGGCNQER